MKFRNILLFMGLLMASPLLRADAPGNYYGIGFIGLDFEAANGTPIKGNQGLGVKFGRELGKFLAIEFHLGATRDSSANVFGEQAEFTYGAALARFNLPYRNFNLYFLGGASQVNFDFGGGVKDDEAAGAAGFGMDFFGSERNALTIELMRYGVDNTSDVLSVGFKHHFEYQRFR